MASEVASIGPDAHGYLLDGFGFFVTLVLDPGIESFACIARFDVWKGAGSVAGRDR